MEGVRGAVQELVSTERNLVARVEEALLCRSELVRRWDEDVGEDGAGRGGAEVPPLSRAEVEFVFGSLEQVYLAAKRLLGELEAAQNVSVDDVAHTYARWADAYAVLFAAYADQHLGALDVLEKEGLGEKLAAMVRPPLSQPLASLLAMPVQRLPRHVLLWDRVGAECAKSGAARESVADAQNAARRATDVVDGAVRRRDEVQQVRRVAEREGNADLVRAGRRLLKSGGTAEKLSRHGWQSVRLFLFSDCILWCGGLDVIVGGGGSEEEEGAMTPTAPSLTPLSPPTASAISSSRSATSPLPGGRSGPRARSRLEPVLPSPTAASSSEATSEAPPPVLTSSSSSSSSSSTPTLGSPTAELSNSTMRLRASLGPRTAHLVGLEGVRAEREAPRTVELGDKRARSIFVASPEKSFVVAFDDAATATAWHAAIDAASLQFRRARAMQIWALAAVTSPFVPSDRIEPPPPPAGPLPLPPSAPMWVPDAAAKACFLCEKPFHTLLRRRHHCRKCGACVCHDCSKSTAHIPSVDPTHPVRVCDACVAQLLSTA